MTGFRTACQDHQTGKSAIKCLSQKHNRTGPVFTKDTTDKCFAHKILFNTNINFLKVLFSTEISNVGKLI